MAFVSQNELYDCVKEDMSCTWKRFLELPGRDRSLFSPTFLEPSLILDELAVKGSGAATLESFYGYDVINKNDN